MIKKSSRNEIFDGGEVYKYKGMSAARRKKSLSSLPLFSYFPTANRIFYFLVKIVVKISKNSLQIGTNVV